MPELGELAFEGDMDRARLVGDQHQAQRWILRFGLQSSEHRAVDNVFFDGAQSHERDPERRVIAAVAPTYHFRFDGKGRLAWNCELEGDRVAWRGPPPHQQCTGDGQVSDEPLDWAGVG